MQRFKNYLFNGSIALISLLVFLLLFENRLSVPAWLQVFGRMHPMILHFPIVLLVLYVIAVVIIPVQADHKTALNNATDLLLALTVFTAALTCLMGLFLSREPGYEPEALFWHKWGAVSILILLLFWYGFNKYILNRKILSIGISFLALTIIIFTGHHGADITHGQNFLLAPVSLEKNQPAVSLDEAVIFTDMVQPVLKSKCGSCHNSKKAKGELVMETAELLLKGGKSGKLWDSTAEDLGLMLRRLHLPLEQKKHMPPEGKPQLTDQEMEIITQWIRKGADFTLKVADLSKADTLYQLADKYFAAQEMAEYDFEEADAAVIEDLNTVNRVVRTVALGSPAVDVSFFNSSLFNAAQLIELSKIKKQIVSLDLSKMPVTDADVKMISEFKNLRKLNLGFTSISGATLGELGKLKYLKSLSLSGTKIGAASLQPLQYFQQLKTVFVWNTPIASAELDKLKKQIKAVSFESGYKGDTTIMKLTLPVVLNEETFITKTIPLKLKHYIHGTAIRFTTDGSEPDSIHAANYTGAETISSNTLIRAKAFKPGWLSSDIVEVNFYKNTHIPDSVIYLTPFDNDYKDEQHKLLIDGEKGETNFRSGKWVGFRKNRMECLLQFNTPVPVQSITLSMLIDIGSYIMPPQRIEIWAGNEAGKLKKISQLMPEQPAMVKPVFMKGYECKFDMQQVKYIKIIVIPVGKLPAWHPGKGDKGWIFADEVLVN